MSEVDAVAVEKFGTWLKSLAEDSRAIADVLADDSVALDVRRPLGGAVNYLFKSLDLIDDGIEGLGYLDDAFVLRVAAGHAKQAGQLPEALAQLAEDALLIEEFLGDLSGRLQSFVRGLPDAVVRGRSVAGILEDAAVREEALGDVRGFASRYQAPQFVMDEQALVKLRAFLGAKLPK